MHHCHPAQQQPSHQGAPAAPTPSPPSPPALHIGQRGPHACLPYQHVLRQLQDPRQPRHLSSSVLGDQRHRGGGHSRHELQPVAVAEQQPPRDQLEQQAAQAPHVAGRPRALAPPPVIAALVLVAGAPHQQHLRRLEAVRAPGAGGGRRIQARREQPALPKVRQHHPEGRPLAGGRPEIRGPHTRQGLQ